MAKKKTSTSKPDAKTGGGSDAKNLEDVGQDSIAADDPKAGDVDTSVDTTAEDVAQDDQGNAPDDVAAEVAAPDDVKAETDDGLSETPAEDHQPELNADEGHSADASDPASQVIPVATQTVVERKGGFLPMLLGGLLAGGIGFGAAYYWFQQNGGTDMASFQADVAARLDQNSKDIAGLSDSVNNLPEPQDLTGLSDEQSNLSASLDAMVDRMNAVEDQLAELDERLSSVEKRPISEGASDAAVAAYERELKALQDTMAAQRAEFEKMAADAASMEDNAEETAQATMLRAALSRIQTAIDSGTGFAPALGDLQAAGMDTPAALNDVAENGVPSLATLRSSFPDAARAALAVSRQEAAENGEQSGFSAFLKNQLGTRSLEPKEGDDPDAVLSRAEAAVREGRLTDALAEIEALPEVGRAALSDWTTNVTRRQAAVTAVEALGQELN